MESVSIIFIKVFYKRSAMVQAEKHCISFCKSMPAVNTRCDFIKWDREHQFRAIFSIHGDELSILSPMAALLSFAKFHEFGIIKLVSYPE